MDRIIHYVKWKTITDFPNYSVSNTGLIKSKDRLIAPKIRRRRKWKCHFVCLVNKETKAFGKRDVHVLVWQHFGNIPKQKGWDTHHKDGNTFNNHIDNLEYLPHAEHMAIHVRLRKSKAA